MNLDIPTSVRNGRLREDQVLRTKYIATMHASPTLKYGLSEMWTKQDVGHAVELSEVKLK